MAPCVPRRRFLQLGASGVAGVLAGCSASPDTEDVSYPEPEYAEDGLSSEGGGGNSCVSVGLWALSLRPNQFAQLRSTKRDGGTYRLTVTIRAGGPVDFLLLPPPDPEPFAEGEPIVYADVSEFPDPIRSEVIQGPAGSSPNETRFSLDPSRVYQVVIDNSRFGETPPGDTVKGELKTEYELC